MEGSGPPAEVKDWVVTSLQTPPHSGNDMFDVTVQQLDFGETVLNSSRLHHNHLCYQVDPFQN